MKIDMTSNLHSRVGTHQRECGDTEPEILTVGKFKDRLSARLVELMLIRCIHLSNHSCLGNEYAIYSPAMARIIARCIKRNQRFSLGRQLLRSYNLGKWKHCQSTKVFIKKMLLTEKEPLIEIC